MDYYPNIWYTEPVPTRDFSLPPTSAPYSSYHPPQPTLCEPSHPPQPWQELFDCVSGRYYYWNTETNITQFEEPWVDSPPLYPSFSPDVSNTESLYQNPFLNHDQSATVINGYTFPPQFPFHNQTPSATNQFLYPHTYSQNTYSELLLGLPQDTMNPSIPTFQSPSTPTFVPQSTDPQNPPPAANPNPQYDANAIYAIIEELEKITQSLSVAKRRNDDTTGSHNPHSTAAAIDVVHSCTVATNEDPIEENSALAQVVEPTTDAAMVPIETTSGVALSSATELDTDLVSLNHVSSLLNPLTHDRMEIVDDVVQLPNNNAAFETTTCNEPEYVEGFTLETATADTSVKKEGVLNDVILVMQNETLPEIEKDIHGFCVIAENKRYDKPTDLFVLFSSVLPSGEEIQSVPVCQSDFKIQQMKAVEFHGQVGLFDSKVCDIPDEGTLAFTSVMSTELVVSTISAISIAALVCSEFIVPEREISKGPELVLDDLWADCCELPLPKPALVFNDCALVHDADHLLDDHKQGTIVPFVHDFPQFLLVTAKGFLNLCVNLHGRQISTYMTLRPSFGHAYDSRVHQFEPTSGYFEVINFDKEFLAFQNYFLIGLFAYVKNAKFGKLRPNLFNTSKLFYGASYGIIEVLLMHGNLNDFTLTLLLDFVCATQRHVILDVECGELLTELNRLLLPRGPLVRYATLDYPMFLEDVGIRKAGYKLTQSESRLSPQGYHKIGTIGSTMTIIDLVGEVCYHILPPHICLSLFAADPENWSFFVTLEIVLPNLVVWSPLLFDAFAKSGALMNLVFEAPKFHAWFARTRHALPLALKMGDYFICYGTLVYQKFCGDIAIWYLMVIGTAELNPVVAAMYRAPYTTVFHNGIAEFEPTLPTLNPMLKSSVHDQMDSLRYDCVIITQMLYTGTATELLLKILEFSLSRYSYGGVFLLTLTAIHYFLSLIYLAEFLWFQKHKSNTSKNNSLVLVRDFALYRPLYGANSLHKEKAMHGPLIEVVDTSIMSIMYHSGLILLRIPPANSSLKRKSDFSSLRNFPSPRLSWEHSAILISNMHKSFHYMVEHMHMDIIFRVTNSSKFYSSFHAIEMKLFMLSPIVVFYFLRPLLAFTVRQDDHCSIGFLVLNSIQLVSLRCKNQGLDSSHLQHGVVTMIFAVLDFLSPSNRGGLMPAMLLLYVFMGLFAGYAYARLYKMFEGTEWKKNAFTTAVLFPTGVSAIFIVLNPLMLGQKSSGAGPFGTMFELFFILTSIWLDQFYYIFGFLFLVFVILNVTCAEITIVLCYFQLCSEDSLWWCSSALYLFLSATFYFFTKLEISKLVSAKCDVCMVEAYMVTKARLERGEVSARVSGANFLIRTDARPEDMPYFKGGGMLGLYLIMWVV